MIIGCLTVLLSGVLQYNTVLLVVSIYFRECSVTHFHSAVYLKLHWE